MLKKTCDLFAGLKITIVSGLFLLASLILMITKTEVPVDPAWVTVILSGYPLLYLAITRLVYQKWISSCLLISIAMVASLFIGELFAAGEVAFIMAIGAILEDMTVSRAKKGLSQLIALAPVQARILTPSGNDYIEKMVPVEKVKKEDLLRVIPGETIPVDGIIVSGESSIDQSIMTGESLPVDKGIGESVFCGTMNCFGSIDIKATKVGEDSSLQKLIRMVEQAEEKKAPMQRIADKWSVWLVPIALLIALAAFFVNWQNGMELMTALNRGVTVLVVFCPCALALATPTSIMAAIGQATKHGVIIKSGAALETLGKADTIVFDKTGTLTYGKLEVTDITPFSNEITKEELLIYAGAVESKSEHPLGKSITAHAKEKNISLPAVDNFQMQAGRGIQGDVNGSHILCGNKEFLSSNNILCEKETESVIQKYQDQGKAIILISKNNSCIGVIALSDILRPESDQVISKLHNMNVQSVLLTGDNKRAANYFAKQTGILNIHAELLPENKVEAIEELKNSGKTVCMIGDGVNDAPALKTADVGVAMGGIGSDIAIEAADAALMHDNISQLVYLKRLASTTLHTIKLNITISMCINAVAVTLSVLGVLNPVTGALVHNAGSVLVVLNAALLYDRKFES